MLFAVESSPSFNAISPPNGSVVSKFEGENTTFFCPLFTGNKSETQEVTIWSILNFNDSSELLRIENALTPSDYLILSGPTRNNDTTNDTLTLVCVSHELDGTSIICGTGSHPQIGVFPLKIYSKLLFDNNYGP